MTGPRYVDATVAGECVRVVNPVYFYSAPCAETRKGLGLFCKVALEAGDCWWAHDFWDQRFVERVVPWADFQRMGEADKQLARRICYVDVATRSLVQCTEPFCRVNHAGDSANSMSEENGNSVATCLVPAGTEITIPYDFDPIISLTWKFPELLQRLSPSELEDEAFLFQAADQSEVVRAFLRQL